MAAEETRLAMLAEEVKRRMSLAVAEHEEVSKRGGLEARVALVPQATHFGARAWLRAGEGEDAVLGGATEAAGGERRR